MVKKSTILAVLSVSIFLYSLIKKQQHLVYMAQKSGNLLIKNILITIDQLFPPISTENNSIYFFITFSLNTRQEDKYTVVVAVDLRSILYSSKTFTCIWVKRVEKVNMMENFCSRRLPVSFIWLSYTPRLLHLRVRHTVNYPMLSCVWVRHTVRNLGPPCLALCFSGGSATFFTLKLVNYWS